MASTITILTASKILPTVAKAAARTVRVSLCHPPYPHAHMRFITMRMGINNKWGNMANRIESTATREGRMTSCTWEEEEDIRVRPEINISKAQQHNHLYPLSRPTIPTTRKSIITRSFSEIHKSTTRVQRSTAPWSTAQAQTSPTDPIYPPQIKQPMPTPKIQPPYPFQFHMATPP